MSPASCMPGGSVGWPASLRAAGASWQLEATALRTHAPVDSGTAVSYCRATAMAAAVLAAAPIVRVMLLMPSQLPISRHLMHADAGVQGVAHLQVSGDSQALAMLLGFRRRSCLWCWHSGPLTLLRESHSDYMPVGLQVVLTQTIPGIGAEGDLTKVANGYFRNYLLPQRMAKPATPTILACAPGLPRIPGGALQYYALAWFSRCSVSTSTRSTHLSQVL